jgi:hypothetical protein
LLNTDVQVRKWKAKTSGSRTSCGQSLYLRGWDDGTKALEFRTKSGWVTLGSYPSLSLAEARAMVPVCKQLLKDNVATTESLKALVTRVNTAHDLGLLAARNVNDDNVSKMQTFDVAYRDWYQRQLKSGIWTHRASMSRTDRTNSGHVRSCPHPMQTDRHGHPPKGVSSCPEGGDRR